MRKLKREADFGFRYVVVPTLEAVNDKINWMWWHDKRKQSRFSLLISLTLVSLVVFANPLILVIDAMCGWWCSERWFACITFREFVWNKRILWMTINLHGDGCLRKIFSFRPQSTFALLEAQCFEVHRLEKLFKAQLIPRCCLKNEPLKAY